MRLSTTALFDAGAIDCHHISFDDEEGLPIIVDARAVFITESSVARAREIEAQFDLHDSEIRRQEFSYGDIVVARIDGSGQTIGSIARGGQDAGICLSVQVEGNQQYLPFSGTGMFGAHEVLTGLSQRGQDLTENENRALASISELFTMAAASPDPDRFPEEIRAMAMRSILLADYANVRMGISDTEMVRYFQGVSLRNQISALDSGHPDASQSRTSHADLLAGMEGTAAPGAIFRNIGSIRNSLTFGRTAHANDVMVRNIFGAMTNTPIEELSVSMMSVPGVNALRENLAGHRLTGDWVEAIEAHVHAVLQNGPIAVNGVGEMGYRFNIELYEHSGRDILLVTDSSNTRDGNGYAYSWPSTDRHLVAEFNGQNFATISPEAVPSEEEIARLNAALEEVRQRQLLEVENFNM